VVPEQRPNYQSNPSIQRLVIAISVASISRIILNTARRFPYPFAPVLSRGLGVPLTAVNSLIAVNQATGMLGLFFGPLADRFGYRLMMLSGLGMLVLGMFAAGFLPYYGVVLGSIFLAGLAKTVFDPAVQAYTGQRIPYRRRGLAIGLLEFSWAGSSLLGIPLIGFLIDRWDWRSPFYTLAGAGLASMLVLGMLLPRDGKISSHRPGAGIRSAWKQIAQNRAAFGALTFGFLVSIAIDNLFVIYGVWLEQDFGLSIIALGLGTGLIGIAEFLGELLTAILGDRIGLKRAVIIGLFLTIISYVLLPFIANTFLWALAGLFIIFLAFEFSIVVFMSLCTEIMPDLRATMMSFFLAASGLGRVVGVLIGGSVWMHGGIMATGMVSAVITALAMMSLMWGLQGWEHR
jgi:predicted MFS family arabinose efflux permease